MNLLISGLKLPLKLLVSLVSNKRKKARTEREKKQLEHVRNFAPTHYSWGQKTGKKSKKRNKKQKK